MAGNPAGVVKLCAISALVAVVLLSPGAASGLDSDTIWTLAGTGTSGNTNDTGQATEAQIDRPRSMDLTSDGGYVWAQPWSNRVRKVASDGSITTIAGSGTAGFSGDGGPAADAELNFVHGAAQLTDGSIVLADELNNRIRRVSPSGIITTVAGDGEAGYSGDGGPAVQASINNPRGIAAMPDGGFLIPDSSNHRVRRVWPNGTITTVAGTGVQGFAGDGGPATQAQLSIPFGVAATADGGFLIVDVGNQRIRRVSSGGTITTVAGTGLQGFAGDGGPATLAQLNNPHAVVGLSDGAFLIADTSNNRVRKVTSTGTITTVAGTGVPGFSGDGGPAPSAQVAYPKGVDVDASGSIVIADETNNRVRFVGTVVQPASVAPPSISGVTTVGSVLTAAAGGWSGTGPVMAYQWRRCDSAGGACSDISGANAKTYVLTSGDAGATIKVVVTASNPAGNASATSVQTSTVTAPAASPSNTTPPTITGTLQEGSTVTAGDGTWTGATPISFAYQWSRCNTSGAACADIAGATAKTYTLVGADVGSTLRVRVNASNSAGASDYSTRVTAAAPTSYWRLGETTGPLVDERGFANGTYLGNPTQGAPGLLTSDGNAAVSLNGSSQYADVPANAAWTPATFSLELLVKPSLVPENRTIWSTMGPGFAGWWLNTGSTGVLRLFIGDGSGWRYDASAPALAAGTAYHLVATYDGSRARVYIDGELVSTGPVASMAPNVGGNVMRFGAFSTGPGQYWPGVIDDASFYPSVLTATDVRAHYEASKYGSSALSANTAVVGAAPPVNTSPPTISGTAQEGQVLTSTTGTWTGTAPITYARQWRRCDSAGAACVDIAGATASSYTLGAAEIGSTVRVRVTATNAASSTAADSAASAVVTGAPGAPVNTVAPTISGNAVSGQTLTATDGTWTGSAPISYTRQWLRCDTSGGSCANIAGATGTSYTLTGTDMGSTVRVRVTATNSAGSSSADSAATAVVTSAPTPPSNTGLPVITGTAQSGQSLSVSDGTWSGTTPITFAYQWRRCDASGGACADIAGATASSYAVVSADVGATLRAVVTASNGGGSSSATSAQTAVVTSGSSSVTATFSVAAGADDGDVKSNSMGSNGSYPPGKTPNPTTNAATFATRRSGPSFGGYEIRVGLLRFDTSSLPDGATITSAKLRLYVTSATSANNRNLVAEWYPAANWPIDEGDYADTGASTAHTGTAISSLGVNASNTFALQNLGSISTTGATAVRLHVDGGQPTGENIVWFAAFENSSPEPQLEITYATTPPSPPVNTSPPAVSGTAQSGQTLTVSNGSWSGSAPIGFAYQWRRCDASGGGCVDIAGATSSSYLVAAADVGATLRGVVTGSNGAGSSSGTSAQTAVVSSGPSSVTVTFSVAAGADDGDVKSNSMGSNGTYPPGKTPNPTSNASVIGVRRSGPSFGGYEIRVALLRFDTSSLPDGATITSARLRLYVTDRTSANNRNLVAEWYPASSWPIDEADYVDNASSTAHAGTAITSLVINALNTFVLQDLASISTTGATALRLHVDGGQPSGENSFWLAAFENASPEAQLEITYSVP